MSSDLLLRRWRRGSGGKCRLHARYLELIILSVMQRTFLATLAVVF